MRKFSDWLKDRSAAAISVGGVVPAIVSAVTDSWVVPRPDGREISRELKRHSELLIAIVSLALIILVAWIDQRTNPHISFGFFYLLIVTFAAWSGGKKAGVFCAFTGSLALFLHEVRISEGDWPGWPIYWNLWMQIGTFLFAAFLVSAVRGLTGNLERRVKERTVALEREIGDRKQTEAQLMKTTQQLRQLAEHIGDAFWMRNADETRMVYVSSAYEKIWGRSCRDLYQSPAAWLEAVHPEDRERVSQAIHNKQVEIAFSQDYRIVRPDATLRWIRERTFPIRNGAGKVVRVVGIAEDITDRRRLEREILEISDREQARLGQDLHDSLCQKLVSLAFDNDSLEQKLAARAVPETDAARQMGVLLDDAITEARSLSRGLFPVQLEKDGLAVALKQLAASVSFRFPVECRLECAQSISIRDNAVATHLYRIAQEAVNNAVKHSQARTILIQLTETDGRMELRVSDDGIGISFPLKSSGMGMHTMEYRARTIGGSLSVGRGPERGTVVSCLVRQDEN
jgi:PAS domain S-box-containing protein